MAYFAQLERSSSFIRIEWIKHALAHSFELQIRSNFYSTLRDKWRVYIPSYLFMGAKMSVLGLIMSFLPYLKSAMVQFPFEFCHNLIFVTIWVLSQLESCHKLSFVTFRVLELCHNLSFFSFVTIWVFEFYQNLSFWILSPFEFLNLITIWVF